MSFFWILCDHNATYHNWPPDTEWRRLAVVIRIILLAQNWNLFMTANSWQTAAGQGKIEKLNPDNETHD